MRASIESDDIFGAFPGVGPVAFHFDLVDEGAKAFGSQCIAASIFHFGMHIVGEAKAHFEKNGVHVRPSFKR